MKTTLILHSLEAAVSGKLSHCLRFSVIAGTALVASAQMIFAQDPSVVAVQERLREQQCFNGETNGIVDDATRNGLRQFQTRKGLEQTGEIDGATWQALQIQGPKTAPQQPVQTVAADNAGGQHQTDREFLQQIEKQPDQRPAEPGVNNDVSSPIPPVPVLAKAAEATSKTAEADKPEKPARPQRVRPIAHAQPSVAAKKYSFRIGSAESDPVAEGAAEEPSPSEKSRDKRDAEKSGDRRVTRTNPPAGGTMEQTITTVTKTVKGPDGRTTITEQKTVSNPRFVRKENPTTGRLLVPFWQQTADGTWQRSER